MNSPIEAKGSCDFQRVLEGIRHVAMAAGLVLGGLAAVPAVKAAEAIQVMMDQAKLVKLPAGAETIVIGNPAVADITVQKNGVMVITGRSAGRTNFIALDSSGAIISESEVTVSNLGRGRVLVQRGLDRSTYDCSPQCLPTVAYGDDGEHFGRAAEQINKRDGLAGKSAGGAGANSGTKKQ